VMLPFTGGTWTWSGPGVSGNYFHPTTLGPHTITLCYTDSFGCTTCITNTINVIFCCGESCQVNAGNDTTICVGSPFTLNAQGCNGNTTWYQLAGTEAIPIGFEPNITVNPQQNTCYMVICCCQGPIQCCDTDTICINVSQGLQPQWLISYVPICVNSVPLYLDESNIFVTINNQLVPITQLGGSGVFSGTNVSGNYFYPNATGVYTITYTYTDPNGCVSTTSINVTVINCGCGPCYKPGPELVVNPGFESGTVGFTSQLSNICNCLVGSYCVTTSAQLKCASHLNIPSTSLPTGNNYLVVDGHGSVARRIWQENITVLNTQNYKFSFWVHPTVSGNTYPKPDLEVRVNSNVILALPGVSLANGWTKYSANVSGISGTSLEIHQTNAGSLGYDYGIDDISFKRCVKSMIVILNPIDVICHGTATGSVKAVVTDGVPPYQYQWSNGEVTDEIANLVAGTYTVTVVDGIGCLEVISATVNSPAPLTPGPISGTYLSACLPAVNSGGSYSIPAIPGVIYSWTVPSGMTIISGQGTNSIFATWNGTNVNAGIVGNVCVTVSNPCQTVTICQKVDINAVKPVTPPSISGPSKVCPGDVATYSIALVPRAASYIWTLPTGMTITSGAGTNVITVSVNASYTGGTISVIAVNACGSSPARTKPVLLNPPAVPGVITGPAGGQCGAVGVSYSIAPVPTATSYQWTVSNGTIVGSSTGTSISVNWSTSFTTGVVSVVAANGCGVSVPRTLSVTGPPSIPGPITGATNVCTGGIYHYSVSSVVGALSYNWTTPGTILNGQGTKEVDIQFTSVPFTNQTISVKAINNCGTGATRILSGVNGNFCIRAADAIEGFNVYPNPARKQLYIEFMADCECRFSAELLDMTGRSVLQGNGIATERLNKTELKLDQIAEGVYFLRFTLNDVTNQVRIVIE